MSNQLELSDLRRSWIDEAVSFITLRMPAWGTFSSDDLHDILPTKPECKNWLGAAVAVLKNEGLIEEAGRITSKRKEANGRRITLWKAKTTSVRSCSTPQQRAIPAGEATCAMTSQLPAGTSL